MSKNLFKRIITSIILLSLLFFINFSHKYITILSILILGLIICIEANKIFSKLINRRDYNKEYSQKKFYLKFLILNVITFCYVFFIFCYLTINIFIFGGPLFFLYILSICFFTDIGGYVFGKIIGGRKLSNISPNKTVSGAIGSFMFSIIPFIFF